MFLGRRVPGAGVGACVTLLTDGVLQNFPVVGKHFRVVSLSEGRIAEFTKQIRNGTLQLTTGTVCVNVGHNQLPLKVGENLGNQIKKLIQEIRKFKPTVKLYILGLIPDPLREQELTPMLISANEQLSQAARDIRRLKSGSCEFLGIAKLFLEKLKYRNDRGEWCFQTRVVRPWSTYFEGSQLNNVGLEFVKSFLLDRLGIIPGACPWKEIPTVVSGRNEQGEGSGEESGSELELDSSSGEELESEPEDSSQVDSSDKEQGINPGCSKQLEFKKEEIEGETLEMDISPQRLKIEVTPKPGKVTDMIKSWEAKVAGQVSVKQPSPVGRHTQQLPDEDSDLDRSTVVPIGSDELDL